MKINKTTLKEFRVDFAKAVKDLEKQYGVHMKIGAITYEESQFRGKLTVNTGEAALKPVRKVSGNIFSIGDKVNILHKTVNPNDVFTVTKVNRLSVKLTSALNRNIKASPNLLRKAKLK